MQTIVETLYLTVLVEPILCARQLAKNGDAIIRSKKARPVTTDAIVGFDHLAARPYTTLLLELPACPGHRDRRSKGQIHRRADCGGTLRLLSKIRNPCDCIIQMEKLASLLDGPEVKAEER